MARVGQKGSSSFERVTWEEALNLIRDKFTEAIERDGSEVFFLIVTLGIKAFSMACIAGTVF